MSALGQKQTFAMQNGMSALPPKADIYQVTPNVRFVPKADIAKVKQLAQQGLGVVPQFSDEISCRFCFRHAG
jgi:hypothetical protein